MTYSLPQPAPRNHRQRLRSICLLVCAPLVCAPLICCLSGCHSAFIEATVLNRSGGAVRNLEIDYPTASFGTETLAVGATFHYRFKVLGSGATKASWTDATGKDHSANGPALHEGQEGTLAVTLDPSTADWHLQPRADTP